MTRRNLFCGLAAFALVLWAGGPALAEDKGDTHEGKVVKVEGSKLTMTDKDGKEHSHDVGKAAVWMDGKEIKLDELKKDQMIMVTTEKGTKKVTKIEVKKEK